MAKFSVGDLVVLKSGSMRMVVEDTNDDETISTVWCNEGVIGRDRFAEALLNKWEHREDSGGRPPRGGDRDGGGFKGRGGDREGGGGGYRGKGGDRDGSGGGYRGKGGDDRGGYKGRGGDRDGDDRPPRKTGWDGKPREKKYFRKDD